jgi:hypothetical protein
VIPTMAQWERVRRRWLDDSMDDDPRAIEGVPTREQMAPRMPDLCPDETRDE